MMKSKKTLALYLSLVAIMIAVVGFTYAAFVDKGEILGTTFTVGSSDLKLVANLASGIDPANLVDELPGPVFNGVSPYWQEDYLLKLYNNGTSTVTLSTNADYETANDIEELRQIIFVEPFEWNDLNMDGFVDEGEEGASLGRKTIVKWKTEGFSLGTLDQGQTKGLILRLSTDGVSDSKQGASAMFDFEFDSTGE